MRLFLLIASTSADFTNVHHYLTEFLTGTLKYTGYGCVSLNIHIYIYKMNMSVIYFIIKLFNSI
jgi:hypothetical protein